MDHGSVGAGVTVYGLRRFGVEAAGIEKDESLHCNVWSRSRKARTSIRGAPPGFPEIDDSEDYMSGLAEEIAQCMLDETDDGSRVHGCPALSSAESTLGTPAVLSTSPQSTLAGMSSWDLLSPGASSGGGLSCGVSSPPTPVAVTHGRNDEDDALELLHAELLRLEMEDEIKALQQQLLQMKQEEHFQQLLWTMRQRQAASLCYEGTDVLRFAQGGAEYATHSSTQKTLGNVHYRKTRDQKAMNGTWGGCQNQGIRHRSWSAMEQSIQVQPYSGAYASGGSQRKAIRGSGMRAVFLGTPGSRESGGTGVFLPRRLGSGLDTRKKPACSTVLLPSRIVQALNLNVEDTLVPNIAPSGVFFRKDALAPARNSTIASQAAACSTLQEVAPGICLPTDWTF